MQTHNRHWQVSIPSHKRWWHTGTQDAERQVFALMIYKLQLITNHMLRDASNIRCLLLLHSAALTKPIFTVATHRWHKSADLFKASGEKSGLFNSGSPVLYLNPLCRHSVLPLQRKRGSETRAESLWWVETEEEEEEEDGFLQHCEPRKTGMNPDPSLLLTPAKRSWIGIGETDSCSHADSLLV